MKWCLGVLVLLHSMAGAEPATILSPEQMRRNLLKLDRSVNETKAKIKTVKDAGFLPELYFALAEFLVEKSRYMYSLKVADNPKTPIAELDFTAEKRPKFEAIQIYDTIIEKFPKLESRDKALFFKGHEQRELGRLEDMLGTYQMLTREYPRSVYWTECQIIIGDYLFEEKKDLDLALSVYQKILSRPAGPFTPLANYKIGWVYVNKNRFKDALLSYERVLKQNRDVDLSQLPEIYRKSDIRREALLALVWPYSEMPAKELGRPEALAYFQSLAPDPISYQKVLLRLSKRLTLKGRFIDGTKVDFELLRLTSDTSERLEVSERLYVNMKNSRADWPVRGMVQEVAKTLTKAEFAADIKDSERKKAWHDLEIFARDVATRESRRAKTTRRKEDWDWAARDYELYLALFPKSRYFRAIKLNLAETYFSAGRFVEAGRAYEELARLFASAPIKATSYLDSAIQSFTAAIRQQTSLSKLLLTEARYGLRATGRQFIAANPNNRANEDILFNIGQTYYDERRFERAIPSLRDYIAKYPAGRKSNIATNLLLDAHNQREDYKAIISDGRAILNNSRMTDVALKNQVREIVQQAEMKAVQSAAGDFSSPDYAGNLLKLARKYKGSNLGDQALYEAFTALKAKKDFKAYDSGEQLLMQHRSSQYALEVTTAMGQMALMTADFSRAALYFEIFYERYSQKPEARDLLKNAAKMRELMGDFKIAASDYKKLGLNLDAARMDYLAQDWSALARSSAGATGIHGAFYEGLAQYRLHGIGPARAALERASLAPVNTPDEREMAAHSLYLLASAALENYKSVKMNEGAEAKAVSEKAARLKALEGQLTKVIRFGDGRWTIAALYSLGQAHLEFARFISQAPTPKSLAGPQLVQYKSMLKAQASPYAQSAKEHFRQCVLNAEKFEVFTTFTSGCLSQGKISVSEANEEPILARAQDTSPQAAAGLRHQLLDTPRDLKLLSQLGAAYIKVKDYSMAELVLNRALEIEPENAQMMANLGVVQLFKQAYPGAKVWFEKSLAKQPKNPLALWGLTGLFKKFHFSAKYQKWLASARAAGQPKGILHPLVQE